MRSPLKPDVIYIPGPPRLPAEEITPGRDVSSGPVSGGMGVDVRLSHGRRVRLSGAVVAAIIAAAGAFGTARATAPAAPDDGVQQEIRELRQEMRGLERRLTDRIDRIVERR